MNGPSRHLRMVMRCVHSVAHLCIKTGILKCLFLLFYFTEMTKEFATIFKDIGEILDVLNELDARMCTIVRSQIYIMEMLIAMKNNKAPLLLTPTSTIREDINDEEEETTPDPNWVDLAVNNDYSIHKEYPYAVIKKNKPHRYLKGSTALCIGPKIVQKDFIVAKQWLDNPNNYTYIEHINGDNSDYHLSNLRWVEHRSKSHKGSLKYEYTSVLPNGSDEVKSFNSWKFKGLYVCNEDFYIKDKNGYRKLAEMKDPYGNKHVNIIDADGHFRSISLNKFKALGFNKE
jgi:hypothetical protein